jgi:pimeloyl-ACP methyl ester carboxylesterase
MGATPCRIRWHIPLSALFCLLIGGQLHAQVGPNGQIDGLTAKFVDVNGVRTRYYDYGEGEAILLVHGGTVLGDAQGSANVWSRNIPGLARKFRVLAVDRVAQGMTGNPRDDRDFGIEGDVEHLYQFIRTMKADKVHLVGHSSSGPLVLYLALQHPEVVKTLAWVSGGAGFRKRGPNRLSALLAKCPPDQTSDEYRRCWKSVAHGAGSSDAFSPDYENAEAWMATLPKSIETRKRAAAIRTAAPRRDNEERAEYRDRMSDRVRGGALQMPVLFYGGKQDLWDWDADAPHAMLPGAMNLFDIFGAVNPRVKFIMINKAGHFVQREQSDQFNADLIQFIEFWNNKPKS